jgi:hypothetical protein
MKTLFSFILALAMGVTASVAQIPGMISMPSAQDSGDQTIGFNPNINRSGIALGNHFILNGYANVEFFSKDEDSTTGGSWMDPIMNMFDKDTGFDAFLDLDGQVKFDPFSLNFHTNITNAILVEQLFIKYQINDVFALEAGKFVSNRTIQPEELNQRFFRTNTYYMQQGFLGTKFSMLVIEELFDLVTDAVNSADQDAIDNLAGILGTDAISDLSNPDFDVNQFMTSVSQAYVEMFSSLMILRDDYKTSYNKGIRANVEAGAVDLSFAITESIWNQMPDMGDGDFGLDLNAVAYLNPSFAAKIGYSYESVESVGSLLSLVVPNSNDDIHNFNTGIEFNNSGFTSSLEFGILKLNPLDTDIWDLALLLHYQFNDLFGLGFRYSHEDLDTPMGDGSSNKFALSFNFNISDHFLVGLGYSVVDADLAGVESDLNELTINSLYSF